MRTLLIGFERQKLNGYGQLRWCEWGQKADYNIADYDRVFINLSAVQTREQQAIVDWPAFGRCFRHEKLLELLFNHGRLVFVGDPTLTLFGSTEPPTTASSPFITLLPLQFDWDLDGGTQIRYVKELPEFEEFLKPMKEWRFALKDFHSRGFLDDHGDPKDPLFLQPVNLACNASGRPIAFGLIITSPIQVQYSLPVKHNGTLVFLPDPGYGSKRLAEKVLDIWREDEPEDEPEWLSGFLAPHQDQIESDQSDLDAEAALLQERNAALADRRTEARLPLRLLYESGKALERVVHEVLRRLGADVEVPEEEEHEDGWITVAVGDDELKGVLEIKSTRNKNFDEHGLNQLSVWKNRGILNRETIYKGVYIGSSSINDPVSERATPFSDSYRRKAQMFQVGVLRGEDLYEIYRLGEAGLLDRERFWRTLFSTDGVFDLTTFLAGDDSRHDHVG